MHTYCLIRAREIGVNRCGETGFCLCFWGPGGNPLPNHTAGPHRAHSEAIPIRSPLPRLLTAAATLLLAFGVLAAAPPSPPLPGPTVAREDTMSTEVAEVLVKAPRITLDEILDRVARGEARRDSLLSDQEFTATFRVVSGVDKQKGGEILNERVMRVYKKRPNRVRVVTLREYDRYPGRNSGANVRFRGGMDEQIVNFAFRPQARRTYRYKIVGRDFVGGHLIYRIEFEPKSTLDPSEPKGTVWVDTNEFVIVRQEVDFERSPVPLFLKDVKKMVIERNKFDEHWVLHRVLVRIEGTFSYPRIGRVFDFTMRFDGYQINQGMPDSLFTVTRQAEEDD